MNGEKLGELATGRIEGCLRLLGIAVRQKRSTVIANDCATADAYATSFMVTGLAGAKKILEKHPELMVYFIYADDKGHNQVWYSPSMKGKILNQ